MTRRGPAWLALSCLFLLAAAAVRAEDAPEPAKTPDEEKPETDPKVIEKKVEEIKTEYEAIARNQDLEQTRRRRELARRLGTLPHPESIKVLHRISEEDSDLRAQIFAMNSLAKIGDLKAIDRLYRNVKRQALKDKKSVLPDYLGPALAGATDPAVGPWVVEELLPSSNKFLRLSAVEALGALKTSEGREPLFKLLEKEDRKPRPDMHLRYEILRALGQIGGDGVRELLYREAKSEDWRNREAVAEVLLENYRDEKAVDVMRDLVRDEVPIVRELAAVAIGRHKIESLFDELVLLMREGNLRAKKQAYESMTAISGQDYGYAPDVWAKWWQDKKKGQLSASGDLKGERISVASYYNFKIFSDRVLFIIDVSGSMKWPDYHPNRIEVAKRELVRAIKALNEKTLFNLATFAGHVNTWNRDGEVPATEENKKKALAWIEASLLPRGATNTYDALMEGLERNPQVDTIYFLSDGIPSTGKYEVPEEILIKLRYANRFRKVIFHTIALAMGKASVEKAQKYEDPEEMAAFMTMIAEMNGGTCLDIRKPYLDLRDDD